MVKDWLLNRGKDGVRGMLPWGVMVGSLGAIALPSLAQSTPYQPPVSPPPQPSPVENPLDPRLFPADPLIPAQTDLTPLQRRRLGEALDDLERQGETLAQAGQLDEAFTLWYRSLRGRQRLGPLVEIQALGRIGDRAWNLDRKGDVVLLGRQLEMRQAQLEQQKALTPEMLTALAQAYRQLHSLDPAIAVYQSLRQTAQQTGDYRRENQALTMLGELYWAKFNYPAAAEVYEILLARAIAAKNTYYEGLYLQKLGEIYHRASEPANAIRIQQQLIERYRQDGQIDRIPDIQISIADHYQALGQGENASQAYQEAYLLAWSIQQLSPAAIALDKLGDLYQKNNQNTYALEIYKRLLRVHQQSYNHYGLMTTYEKIAQLYLQAQQPSAALVAYQQALSLARSLKFATKENALLNQIQTLGVSP